MRSIRAFFAACSRRRVCGSSPVLAQSPTSFSWRREDGGRHSTPLAWLRVPLCVREFCRRQVCGSSLALRKSRCQVCGSSLALRKSRCRVCGSSLVLRKSRCRVGGSSLARRRWRTRPSRHEGGHDGRRKRSAARMAASGAVVREQLGGGRDPLSSSGDARKSAEAHLRCASRAAKCAEAHLRWRWCTSGSRSVAPRLRRPDAGLGSIGSLTS